MVKFIVTAGFLGVIPFMPGTFGSLPGLLCFRLVHMLSYGLMGVRGVTVGTMLLQLMCVLGAFVAGVRLTNSYIQSREVYDADPKEVVIDEVVGQWLVYVLVAPLSVFEIPQLNGFFVSVVAPFIFFRFFDIFKPWPICWVDKNVDGGLGVMLDDVVAALFAALFYYGFVLFAFDGPKVPGA